MVSRLPVPRPGFLPARPALAAGGPDPGRRHHDRRAVRPAQRLPDRRRQQLRTWAASRGLSGFGTPGAASGVRTLPVEAVRELQILIAPFDVRYGNFAGGLVNAVTRSGSNRWEGSVTSYFQDQSLTGLDSAGNRAVDFSTRELTVTLGGPIVRDRAAFFRRRRPAAIRRRARPFDRHRHHRRRRLARLRLPPGRRGPLPGHPQEHLPRGPGLDRAGAGPQSGGKPLRQGLALAGAEPAHRAVAQLRARYARCARVLGRRRGYPCHP